jgi:hypothetical protein
MASIYGIAFGRYFFSPSDIMEIMRVGLLRRQLLRVRIINPGASLLSVSINTYYPL